MVASLFAAFSCVGCISSDTAADILPAYMEQGPVEFSTTEKPVRIIEKQIRNNFRAKSRKRLGSSNWAVNNDVLKYHASRDFSPRALRRASQEVYVGEWEFNAPLDKAGFDLDLSVNPHARIEKTDGHEARKTGAEIRVGQIAERVDQRGKHVRVDSWYMFVGTDNEALCWDVGDKGAKINGVALRDQVTVGDWHAGVAFHKAGGELSIGVMRRETRFEEITTIANIAALSFTMRR